MSRRFSLREILVLGLWIGLLGGFAEVMLLGIARFGFHRAMHAEVSVIWAVPVSLAMLGGLIALPAAMLARTRAGERWPALPLGILCFVAIENLALVFFQIHPWAKLLLAAAISAQLAIFLTRRQEGLIRLAKRTLVPLVGLAGVLAAGTLIMSRVSEAGAIAALPAPRSDARSVLLIVLDTQRALDLSLYGYHRRTTPTLEQLAARGTVFDRAYATSSWTLSSHASMFTGRLPEGLGAGWLTPLDQRHRTLAEIFADRGYLTAGFSANQFYVTRASGLAQGFVHFEGSRVTPLSVLLRSALGGRLAAQDIRGRLFNSYQTPSRKSARHLRESVLAWLDRAPDDRPYFAFINYYDAHQPYLPPPPFDTMFTGRRASWETRNPMLETSGLVTPGDATAERDAYDQAIAYQDHELGLLLRQLQQAGRLRNTIIVITADHGEEFGEHGLLDHGLSLNPAALWVPLLLIEPGEPPGPARIREVVSLVDLPATILQMADSTQAIEVPGVNLTLQGKDPGRHGLSTAIAELPRGIGTVDWAPVTKGPLRSLTRSNWHYIVNAEGDEILMDLSADPAGRVVNPNSSIYRTQVGLLRHALESAVSEHPDGR